MGRLLRPASLAIVASISLALAAWSAFGLGGGEYENGEPWDVRVWDDDAWRFSVLGLMASVGFCYAAAAALPLSRRRGKRLVSAASGLMVVALSAAAQFLGLQALSPLTEEEGLFFALAGGCLILAVLCAWVGLPARRDGGASKKERAPSTVK